MTETQRRALLDKMRAATYVSVVGLDITGICDNFGPVTGNFYNTKLTGLIARGVVFNNCDFGFADLSGADLTGARFINCPLARANLSGADLTGTKIVNCSTGGTNMTDAKIGDGFGVTASGGIIGLPLDEGCLTRHAAWLRWYHTRRHNSNDETLVGCQLVAYHETFDHVDFTGYTLKLVELRDCTFIGCDFSRVVFSDCTITGDFRGCDFTDATLNPDPVSTYTDCVGLRMVACSNDGCENEIPAHTSIRHNGGYCPDCLTERQRCACCTDWILRDEAEDIVDYGEVCENCRDNNFRECGSCLNLVHANSYDDDPDSELCNNCYRNRCRYIRDYSDRTASRYGPFGPGPLYFGVELEVESTRDYGTEALAKQAIERIGDDFAICKYDGSLSDGFEIVTAPAELAEHTRRFHALLGKPFRGLKSWTTSTCGMHVHISRKALTQLQIGKMLVFLNDHGNRKLIDQIAGREPNSYCQTSSKKKRYPAGDTLNPAMLDRDNLNRYEALNLTNEHTVEVRIFRGTLLYEGVMRNIEFCHALVQFCHETGLFELDAKHFLSYVARTPRVWPNMARWLRDNGWLKQVKAMPGTERKELVDA